MVFTYVFAVYIYRGGKLKARLRKTRGLFHYLLSVVSENRTVFAQRISRLSYLLISERVIFFLLLLISYLKKKRVFTAQNCHLTVKINTRLYFTTPSRQMENENRRKEKEFFKLVNFFFLKKIRRKFFQRVSKVGGEKSSSSLSAAPP